MIGDDEEHTSDLEGLERRLYQYAIAERYIEPDRFSDALHALATAAMAVHESWNEARVPAGAYPRYLPPFDEFVLHLQAFRDTVTAGKGIPNNHPIGWITPPDPDIAADYWVTRRGVDAVPGYGTGLPDIRERYRWDGNGAWITGYSCDTQGRKTATRSCLQARRRTSVRARARRLQVNYGALIGYVDRLSARPGERIAVKVSSQLGRPYRADLVRIIHGDPNPAGPGIKLEEIPASHPSRRRRKKAAE